MTAPRNARPNIILVIDALAEPGVRFEQALFWHFPHHPEVDARVPRPTPYPHGFDEYTRQPADA